MLEKRGIKMLVVACNTVSAVALDMLRVELDMPVLGVIEPGARAAVKASHTGKVGVIATAGTVASNAYPRAAASFDSRAEITQRAAPLLVPLAEEGWLDGEVPRLAVRRYIEPLIATGIDTLVLGCTHYPLLAGVISQVVGPTVTLIDSARATAEAAAVLLGERDLLKTGLSSVERHFFVTDVPERFIEVGSRFLGRRLSGARQVDLKFP